MSSGGEHTPNDGNDAPAAGNDTPAVPDDAPAAGNDTPATEKKRRRWPSGLELFVAVALGLAAVASAYAAWRNEQRNHDASAHFSEGIRDYDDGGQFYGEGQSVLSRDQSLFLEYAKAKELRQDKLSKYIFLNLMSPTLQAGVRWWEGPNEQTSHPARNPFTPLDPEYHIAQLDDANKSYDSSRKNFTEARADQEKADHYTLVEVILATALFLYGIAGVTRNRRGKLATVTIGTLIFLTALMFLITG